jgi:3',5'-nucleoside bisphosphate phosphatase
MSNFVDLHSHSTASDGTDSPAELIRKAKAAGLSAIALTDHDTVAGVEHAEDEARKIGIDFLPGIEISCGYPRPGTMHLLGYGVDPAHPALLNTLSELVEARNARNAKLLNLLQKQGIAITMEMVQEASGGGVVGRPHFAKVLMNLGIVKTNAQAFAHYLGGGATNYIDKERLMPGQAIKLIHDAGGVVSLAHPVQLRRTNRLQLQHAIKDLVDMGLDAIECIHSDHRDSVVAELEEFADRYGLLKTGGSDYHGAAKRHIQLGFARQRRVPRDWFDRIRRKLGSK